MRGILNPTMSSQTNQQYLDYYDSMNLSEHWRPEHYMAFQQSNDYNQFFYFFHRPKEKLKLGPFSQEENHLFFNNLITLFQTKHVTLEELKGNWGIFSLYMPFRNGLSCYSHYLSFKARYSAGNSKDLSELIKNMGSLLKNVKDPHDFCNFFINLEPGFIQTTNQQELLEKMNIDIKNLIKEILEIKLENFSELYPKISHPYEISETKQKFKDFLKKCPPKSKHLEIAKPLKIEDSSKGIDRTTVKKSKHQKFDFLYDEVKNFNLKIKDENTCKNRNFDQSGETVQIIKTSSKKSLMGKRNYVEMKEKNSQNKPLHYFGFNERVLDDEGYDSEPNLNHIFAKYLENKEKSNKKKNYPYTEDEEEIDNYYILDKIKAKTLKENLEKKKQRNFFQKKNSILKKKLKAKNTKKEMKIFVYQEDRLKQRKKMIRKKNLKIEDETSIEIEDTLIIPTQILKYESDSDYKFNKRIKYENNSKNIKRKQTFIDESIDMEDYTLITSPTKIEERENTNFFIPKETIGKKKSSLTLINSFKLYEKLRNESLQRKNDIISEELTFESSIINCGSSLSLEELIKINRSLKKMKYCLQTHKLGIDDLNEIQTLISLISNLFVHKKIDKELFSNDKVFKTLVEEIKQILLTKAFSLFSLISLDSGTIYYKILIDFWGLLAKVIVELEANSFYPELKSFLLFYCQINFEAFYLKIIILIQMNCSLYDEFIENEKLFCCLLDFYSSIQEKTKIQILQETSNNFLSGIKKGIIKFQSLFASQNTEKQRKTIIEKLKTIKGIPFINFFFDNPNTPQENRFLEYIFWLYPYSNDQNYEQITSRIQTELTTFGLVLNQSLSLILLLFVELLPKTNFSEFITLFLENLFFSDIFPISSSTNLENSLKIFEYIFSNFGLETIYFLKLKEKIIQTILYKEFSNKFTSITRNDSSDLLEKMIMKFNNNDFSSSNISWELKLVCLFAKSLENEKSKTSISEIPFLEKRVFSRMLCSFKQYDKFHGDLLKNNEFIVFRLEFYLLNALVFLFQKEDLLLNAYRFSIKFLKNYENSHGFVKQMMFNFQRHLLLSIFRSVSKKEIRNNLEYLPEKFKIPVNELWVKFLGILRQFLDIGKFLQNFSLNPQNLTENERALEKNHIDLKENLEENIDLLKEMLKINPIIGKSFLENLTNTSGETSVLLCFKLDSIIFPSTRIKILEFLKEIYQNIENFEVWWEDYLKNDQENERKELDYEEILKEYKRKETFETQLRKIQIGFLETAGFVKLLEMICSILNKPLQERTSPKFWMTEKLLKFCFGLLGFFSQILLRSNEEKHIILVFEKITQTFLDLNSTFFLDNSIKVVTNYNQNQFNTLQRFEKFQMMSKMLKNLLKNVEKAQIFKISILKNKSFEDFILGTYMIFGISLFFFDSKNKDLIQIFKQLEILHLNFIKNKINTSGNYKYMKENKFSLNFNETNSLFECFFFGKCENNNVRQKNNSKILKNMIKNFHENSKNMKQIWKYFDDFFSFILKYLRLETLTVNNSNNVLKNCLILMRHSLNFLENNQENTTKILKIHQDFVTFLFKRPKFAPLEMMFQIPQGWDEVCKSLIKYLCIFSKCLNLGLLKSDEDLLIKLLGTILEQEMKSFENKNISFIKLLETVLAGAFQGHLNKINLILRITEKYFRNQEDNNNIAFSFIQTIFYAFFKENGYKYQPFFIFVLIIEQINYLFGKDIKELQVYSLVFADILQKIDFRFIMKLYDGKNFETDGFKSLEMYLRISRNLLNSLFSFSEIYGNNTDLNEISTSLKTQLHRIILEISCSFDRDLIKKLEQEQMKQIPKKIIPMNFLKDIDKNKLLSLCEETLSIITSFDTISTNNGFIINLSNSLESSLIKCPNFEHNFLYNLVILMRKTFKI